MRAAELFEQRRPSSEVARAVGMHPESVRRWKRLWEQGGAEALKIYQLRIRRSPGLVWVVGRVLVLVVGGCRSSRSSAVPAITDLRIPRPA
ncbi:helix-turn-helix domain-containing protein [Streptomyces sp. AC558_RSS880]|uniref:helix-turn-helix domain-containing protein n=1 Tax=Streptomyces sp. AC558_RSS880 TaxID=2823687 RepID=UPI0035B1A3B4